MRDDWKDNRVADRSEGPTRQWYVRVEPRDGKRETALEMWRWLQSMGVKKSQVEKIDDHSFKVWVSDRQFGEFIYNALKEKYGA